MSILHNPLFFLPIHRRSYAKYYKECNDYIAKKKKKLEKDWNKSFDKIPKSTKTLFNESWYREWPYWKFNDIAGYLDIGMDKANSMTADIFLKRKHFPRGDRIRGFRDVTVIQNNNFFYYLEIYKRRVDTEDNASYLTALKEIIRDAKRILRERNKNFKLWLPPFDFSCFNFVEAYKQAKTKQEQ